MWHLFLLKNSKIESTPTKQTRPIPIQIFILTRYKKISICNLIYKPWKRGETRTDPRPSRQRCRRPPLETEASCFTHPSPTDNHCPASLLISHSHWPTSMTDSVLVSQNTSSSAWVFILSSLETSNWIKKPILYGGWSHSLDHFEPRKLLPVSIFRIKQYSSLTLMIFSPMHIASINKLAVAVALGSKPSRKTKIFIMQVLT